MKSGLVDSNLLHKRLVLLYRVIIMKDKKLPVNSQLSSHNTNHCPGASFFMLPYKKLFITRRNYFKHWFTVRRMQYTCNNWCLFRTLLNKLSALHMAGNRMH
jgi:hypothetical protein